MLLYKLLYLCRHMENTLFLLVRIVVCKYTLKWDKIGNCDGIDERCFYKWYIKDNYNKIDRIRISMIK